MIRAAAWRAQRLIILVAAVLGLVKILFLLPHHDVMTLLFRLLVRLFKAYQLGILRQIILVFLTVIDLLALIHRVAILYLVFLFNYDNLALLQVYHFTKFRRINYFLRQSNDHIARGYPTFSSLPSWHLMSLQGYLMRFREPQVFSIVYLLLLTSSRIHNTLILLIPPSRRFTYKEALRGISPAARWNAKFVTLSLCKSV